MGRTLGVVGSSGRLGGSIAEAARADGWSVTLSATRQAWDESSVPDVVIDASHRSAVAGVANYCAEAGCALVEAVSGLDDRERESLSNAALRVPVVLATNLSRGNYLQMKVLSAAARAMRGERQWGVRVTDRHPTTKLDRPSATALRLADVCADAGIAGERISIESFREGNPVSDHAVIFFADGESFGLVHEVTDMRAAARGALLAAAWASSANPGLWIMNDVWQSQQTSTTAHLFAQSSSIFNRLGSEE